MIPYIVKGTVYVTPYMGNTHSTDDIRIVVAQNEEDARLKYEKYWNDKTVEYSIYYRTDFEVTETLT